MKLSRLPEPTISVGRLALWWDVSSKTVRRWIEAGDLEGEKRGPRWFVSIRSANDYQQARRVKT